ncbi:TetR/AcrR family transcriptional regulator [Streptomyces fuscigenes]|uniref:TetR/AcrR family transcriptional regulator n=1 Tax=Streptomyces fuscigenes TaxID=1528880 RepID=UPI001F42CB94|nr:TetR/AcrR family transcriptional regulator [Streptomyces fuscigenes]MCF3963278.1 TetR/AcrR family transcriptional regulator [Streptomyces fuscigenes]
MARRGLREELVEAAVLQFHTYGYNGAGVKDITDAAGAPKGSFYNHFPSKEALAVVALERYGAGRGLEALTDPSVDPLLRLRQHFEFHRDEHLDLGFSRGCLIGTFATDIADHSDTLREAVRVSLERWSDALATAIGQAREAGLVGEAVEPATTARFLLNAWEGTLISARTDRSAKAFTPFFDLVFGVLLR